METLHNRNDVLKYYLYKASASKQFKIRKILYHYIIPIVFIFIGIFNYINTRNSTVLLIYTVIALAGFLFLPRYLKHIYKRHYENFIDKNLSELFGKNETIEIADDKLINKNVLSESKVDISQIKYLVELKDNYIISINDSASLIVPKNDESARIVNTIKNKNNLTVKNETNWKW
ncbi:hypothetical protein [Breznakiella homolactica]|uniref:YcxB-like protein domain-containing protein n=1 Tax=Breznakiella homolactica TaxID=2798577 RepID=A0A7T7XQG8_9SPIR|nr:hypothetical protein [Breznakiella homolactica]QQO10537.1 hypothetical protein JFL75_06380 [Breznakiella homolactica]